MGEAMLLKFCKKLSSRYTMAIDLLSHHSITTVAGHGSHRWSAMVTRLMFSLGDTAIFAE
jgi:hypothetical protein